MADGEGVAVDRNRNLFDQEPYARRGEDDARLSALEAGGGGGEHPNLATHDALGLATQAELNAHAATSHGGVHPDLAAHDSLGLATQAELNGHVAAADPHTGYATDADLGTHAADTTAIHGIADTSQLALTTHNHDINYEPLGTVDNHNNDWTGVHGITDTQALATDAEVATAVTNHEAAVNPHAGYATDADLTAHAATSHGTAHPNLAAHDTLGLATQAELDTHAATAGHTHPNLVAHDTLGLATQAELNAHNHDIDYEALGAVDAHNNDWTGVHGITDTQALATDAEVATAVSNHEVAANPHPNYATDADLSAHAATSHGGTHPDLAAHDTLGLATQAELNAHNHDISYEELGATDAHNNDWTNVHGITDTQALATDAEVATAVTAHANAGDPHTGYQKESEKDTANGYAGLNSSGLIPEGFLGSSAGGYGLILASTDLSTALWRALDDADIPATIARDSEVTAAVAAHAAAGDPHTGYATDADLTAHAATPHGEGGTHPDLATHDALGLATDAELASRPLGALAGPAKRTTNQGGITAEVDLTGLTVTVTVMANRLIKITGFIRGNNTTSGAQNVLVLQKDTVTVQVATSVFSGAIETIPIGFVDEAPSAGEHTYKLRAAASSGTMTMAAGATTVAYLLVEDIGPA